ncbi:hypothetical protein IW261DRAFT_275680 [Armillaria novae-zelandiae]|uniref:F-box domain-containing protein n=1 Tax=Armillaria novae-zelandiae TaxID=153914 RepID=A0AA39N857_9AGAR|nr:hypothetical protein IW261DRAFT_275680 [Armillaria novae-zelandiae]
MHLLDLPRELLSYIIHFADPDTLRALCLTEKRTLHTVALDLLQRNVTVRLGPDQKSTPNISSFEAEHLAAIRSLSIIVDGFSDLGATSLSSVLGSMVNITHIRVSGGSGTFLRLVLENTKRSELGTLELDQCDAEPQDFSNMAGISIRDLRIARCHANVRFLLGPVTVVNLEVHGVGLDGECMHIGLTLRRLTDAHLGQLRTLCLIGTCCDAGCRDLLHMVCAFERPFSSLEELILDIPLSNDIHRKLMQLLPAFPVLKNCHVFSRHNEDSLSMCFLLFLYRSG